MLGIVPRFDPDYTAGWYDRLGEGESARWAQDGRAKLHYELCCSHLRSRIGPGQRVLDAGCGPGTFSRVARELGARVTCVDLSPVQLAACREAVPDAEHLQASITDLSDLADESFDVTLALGGALSYCFEEAAQALGELMRVTRRDGTLGLSVMSLFGTVHTYLSAVLAMAPEARERLLREGDLGREDNEGHECHLFRARELRELVAGAGADRIELHSGGWITPPGFESNAPTERALLGIELDASEEAPAAGTHITLWARKP